MAVNQTLVEKYGTHEASFYQLINDNVRQISDLNTLLSSSSFNFNAHNSSITRNACNENETNNGR